MSNDNDLYVQNKMYANILIYPDEPESYNILHQVDRRCRDALDIRYGLRIDRDWYANTIAMTFLYTVFEKLAKLISADIKNHKEAEVTIYDIITIKVSNKINEDGEKVGNLNVSFKPGDMLNKVISRGTLKEEASSTIYDDFVLNDGYGNKVSEEDLSDYIALDNHTSYAVHGINGIILPPNATFISIAVFSVFFEKLYEEIMMRLKNTDDLDTLFINMSDIIEVNAVIDNSGNITVYMSPGKEAKLAIKSDYYTEDTN